MPYVDQNNVHEFVGKTIDATRRLFHCYPLTILRRSDGFYYKVCNHGVIIRFDEPIYYDTVVKEA